MLQFAKKTDNFLSLFLNLLQVQYTSHYASKLYYEHPYYNSLFGISQMLFVYNIDNTAIELNKKEDILLLDMPLVACFQNDFVLVYKITRDKVYYKTEDYDISISLDLFYEQFTGIVLIAEKTDNTIEPDYGKNQQKERFNITLRVALSVSIIALIAGIYLYNHLYVNLWEQFALLINFAGIYVGFLLTKKSLHIHSKQADRICSLFKQSSCNNILESKDAKFLGLIGWSEIGLGYFVSNILILLFIPSLISYYAIINIFTLPYSFWSVWYQKFKVKQWCPLCLIVQLLLWLIFMVNILFKNVFHIDSLNVTSILLLFANYSLPLIIVSLLLPILTRARQATFLTQSFNSLKMKDEVMGALIKSEKKYELDHSTSQVIFGNRNADLLISIVTNPLCGPCARLHARIENLLTQYADTICIQYIFAHFQGDDKRQGVQRMIAAYKNNDVNTARKIYDEWYSGIYNNESEFIENYNYNVHAKLVEEEIFKHDEFTQKNKILATPTIFINGYKLPESYRIEDIVSIDVSIIQ